MRYSSSSRPYPLYQKPAPVSHKPTTTLRTQTVRRLRQLGISWWSTHMSEARYLPRLLHPDEELGGVLYGWSGVGRIMLVATDRRIIYLDCKPLFVKSEDITYDVVAGITMEWLGPRGTLILHTRLGDFAVQTTNHGAAQIFHDYIDKRCIEHQNGNFRAETFVRRDG